MTKMYVLLILQILTGKVQKLKL